MKRMLKKIDEIIMGSVKEPNYFVGEGVLLRNVKIGKGSKIWHYCNLFDCTIGENTQIGAYSEIKKDVLIGNNCRIQNYACITDATQIGNNVFIAPRVTFLNDKFPTAQKTLIGLWNLENVVVEDNVTIGGGSVILPRVHIGERAFIGAGSVVTKNVPAKAVVYGNPARVVGDVNMYSDELIYRNSEGKNMRTWD